MELIYMILLLGALASFAIAAANVTVRVNLVALGLALWVAVPLIQAIRQVS